MSPRVTLGPRSDRGLSVLPGCKVFSATMRNDRDALGERVTEWLRANPNCSVTETNVRQSSDNEFHCLSIVVFYEELMG